MLVKSDQLDSWTLEKALDVAESNVLYAAPDNSDHDIHLPDGFMDVDGDMITPWQTYVHAFRWLPVKWLHQIHSHSVHRLC